MGFFHEVFLAFITQTPAEFCMTVRSSHGDRDTKLCSFLNSKFFPTGVTDLAFHFASFFGLASLMFIDQGRWILKRALVMNLAECGCWIEWLGMADRRVRNT